MRERELRILAANIHAAAGNKAGMKAAEGIRLVPPETDPETGQEKREIRYIPYEKALRWFPNE